MKYERHSFLQLIVLSLLFILVSCTQISSPQTAKLVTVSSSTLTATLTALPSPIFTTPISVGAAPRNCPPSQTAQTLSPNLAPVVGKSPVWVTLPALIPLREGYTQYGWAYKLIWEIGPNFPHTVTLHGTNLRTNASLLFQIDQDPPTPSPLLDPRNPGHPAPAFGDGWVGILYLSSRSRLLFARDKVAKRVLAPPLCCWKLIRENATEALKIMRE